MWRFDRAIDDRRNGVRGRVTGELTLTPEEGRIRWAERGVLEWRGNSSPVSRTLFLEERGDGWFVNFEDGLDFHPWTPGTTVRHPCGADLYTGQIDGTAERWSITWTATGPNKDYTMITELTRLKDGDQNGDEDHDQDRVITR